ncbi:hypothetical protein [Methylomonas albis]|nr:hypothetical protein [Methylomonas albis]
MAVYTKILTPSGLNQLGLLELLFSLRAKLFRLAIKANLPFASGILSCALTGAGLRLKRFAWHEGLIGLRASLNALWLR